MSAQELDVKALVFKHKPAFVACG